MDAARNRTTNRSRMLRLLPPLFLALLLSARLAHVLARLARDLPEGPVPVLRFAFAAAVLCAAPGLALLRLLRPDSAARLRSAVGAYEALRYAPAPDPAEAESLVARLSGVRRPGAR